MLERVLFKTLLENLLSLYLLKRFHFFAVQVLFSFSSANCPCLDVSLQSEGAASPASSHSSQFDEMIAARRRRMAQDKQVFSGLRPVKFFLYSGSQSSIQTLGCNVKGKVRIRA